MATSMSGDGGLAPPAYTDGPPSYEEVIALEDEPGILVDAVNSHQSPEDSLLATLTPDAAINRRPPGPDTCLVHLKLLHAIHEMKEAVGYMDGLWGICDSHADGPGSFFLEDDSTASMSAEEKKKLSMSKLREKRWALFVARAVDRYETWWNTLPRERVSRDMLFEADMRVRNNKFVNFTRADRDIVWERSDLPPLDVLMVMHSHMLSPRNFLEDCIRLGHRNYWNYGMPWTAIAGCIDGHGNYAVPSVARDNWWSLTGHEWENTGDPMTKLIQCPFCTQPNEVPWTTYNRKTDAHSSSPYDRLIGTGFGDGNLSHSCGSCHRPIVKETLSFVKFIKDVNLLLDRSVPMPGTLLNPVSGQPEISTTKSALKEPWTFPNRLIKNGIRQQLLDLDLTKVDAETPPTMDTVRQLIENNIWSDKQVRNAEEIPLGAGIMTLRFKAKLSIRRMMSRYWNNFSAFALELCGAVMRHGVFIDKMVHIDWLHSPTAHGSMKRHIVKYGRFMAMIVRNPKKFVVPTLDIDLAWHTHQLAPQTYYTYTDVYAERFIDHDDKVEENRLSDAFEWTTKTYQDAYQDVYSECTCWYCESIRVGQVSAVSVVFGASSSDKILEKFYTSGAAGRFGHDKAAHISSHNAVKSIETPQREEMNQKLRARQQEKLDQNYAKAMKRAAKKGRTLPPKGEYYSQWGQSYYMYAPFIHPMYLTTGLYYGWDPSHIHSGSGAWANCAAGSCGPGAVAAGGCGGPGGCGGGDGACGASLWGNGGDFGGGAAYGDGLNYAASGSHDRIASFVEGIGSGNGGDFGSRSRVGLGGG